MSFKFICGIHISRNLTSLSAERIMGVPNLIEAVSGLLLEGIGCLLAGMWGSGNGTTSYSENVGAIGITKVRR